MITSEKNNSIKLILLLLIFIVLKATPALSGIETTQDTTKIKLGQHLKKEGFAPTFSAGAGMVSMIGYGTYGISARAFVPLPFGFRLVTDYTNYISGTLDWRKESHIDAVLQYPIFSHGRLSFYSSIGSNFAINETIKDHTINLFGNPYTFYKGTDYYLNFMLGVGAEFQISKTFVVYNEWNLVNEDILKSSLGMKINFITLAKNK